MTKLTITRERAQQIFLGNGPEPSASEERELARMALSAMDSEPVAFINGAWTLVYYRPPKESGLKIGDKLYRHAQQPLSVVPDESYQQLSDLYHAQEKRLFKIAQRIKGPAFDKYSHSPSQAIDVLEAAIFGEDDASRAAMLQAGYAVLDLSTPLDPQVAEYEQNVMQAGNSPVIGIDPASGPDRTVEVRYVAPPGYVMVPKEPTAEMVKKMRYHIVGYYRNIKEGYKAMLAAAPQELK